MNEQHIRQLVPQLQAMVGEYPVEFILALGQVLATVNPDEIKTALPVYAKHMHDAGRPLTGAYIRVLGATIDAARLLADASATARNRWQEVLTSWPHVN